MTSRAIINGWPLAAAGFSGKLAPIVPTLTLTGPLSFTVGAAAGTLVANIGNVPNGVTPTITPGDGRLVIAGDQASGWKVVVGLTASTVGTIALSVAATGATGVSTTVTVNSAAALNELRTSGLLTNGLASSGIITGVESGYTPTTTQQGLTIGSQTTNGAWPYTWDGVGGTSGVNPNRLSATKSGSPSQTGQTVVLPASTGNLKLGGRMFFVGEAAPIEILAGYASTSVLSATVDDGTSVRVTVDGQGYPIIAPLPAAAYAYSTPGIKIISTTETKSDNSTTVSTMAIYVAPVPSSPTVARAKPLLQRITSDKASAQTIAVAPSPPTLTINTGASLVNGRSLAAGGSTANASVPQGKSGVAGATATASGYIYADTTNGPTQQTFAPGPTFEWVFTGTTGSRFDFKASYPGTSPTGTMQIMIFVSEDADTANPTWYSATAEPHNYGTVVAYYDVNFGSPPARAGSRAVRVMLGLGVAVTGFNFETGATIAAFEDGKLRGAAWNDSFDFNQAIDYTIDTQVHTFMRQFGSFNGVNFGHRTNAWTRLGGTTGVHARVADRFGSNPYALDEMTRFGALNLAEFHMSINDFQTGGYNSIGTGAAAPKFNVAGGSNAIIPGSDTFNMWIQLAFRRARYMQPDMMIVVDAGFAAPDQMPNSTYITAVRTLFDNVFSNDPLAVFYDYTTETYRYMGQTYSTGQSQALVPGAMGSGPYWPYNVANITATINGDELTVSAIDTRLDVGMYISTGGTGGNFIAKQVSGTPGGVGVYKLLLPQTAVSTPTSMVYWGDSGPAGGAPAHPTNIGGRLRGIRNANVMAMAAAKGAALA